jgi:hypothetical protein
VTYTVYESVAVPRQVTAPVTTYQTQAYTQPVTSTVHETVPVQRQYSVPVTTYRNEQRTKTVQQAVVEYQQEIVMRREFYCVTVPYQTTVRVPVYAPAAPSAGFGGWCGGGGWGGSGCCN